MLGLVKYSIVRSCQVGFGKLLLRSCADGWGTVVWGFLRLGIIEVGKGRVE